MLSSFALGIWIKLSLLIVVGKSLLSCFNNKVFPDSTAPLITKIFDFLNVFFIVLYGSKSLITLNKSFSLLSDNN